MVKNSRGTSTSDCLQPLSNELHKVNLDGVAYLPEFLQVEVETTLAHFDLAHPTLRAVQLVGELSLAQPRTPSLLAEQVQQGVVLLGMDGAGTSHPGI